MCVLYYADAPKGFPSIGARRLKKSTQQNFDTPFHADDVVPDLKSRKISPQKSIKNCFTGNFGKSSKIIWKKKSNKEAKINIK